jgi:hypothetical protein
LTRCPSSDSRAAGLPSKSALGTGFAKLALSRAWKEGARCRLHVLEIATKRDQVVAEDSDQHCFTWSNVSWHSGQKGLVLTTLLRVDRNKGNLAYVPITGEKASPKVLTDTAVPRTLPQALKH